MIYKVFWSNSISKLHYQEFHSLFNSVSAIFDMSFEHAAHFVKCMLKRVMRVM